MREGQFLGVLLELLPFPAIVASGIKIWLVMVAWNGKW